MTLHPSLGHAIEVVQGGDVILIPTDTVYGVAASLAAPPALDRVFELKRRPRSKALPILAASIDALDDIVILDERSLKAATRFWPGPLTLVASRAPGFEADIGGRDRSTVAVRIPAHEIALEILAATGPLAVTSANRSGEPPPRWVDQARAALGNDLVYVDGGPAAGTSSTVAVIDDDVQVLREGAISEDEIRQIVTS